VPENILTCDIAIFQSYNQPNSWLYVEFNPKKDILSWYGIDHYNPKSWILETSNDYLNWIVIDQKINQNWITQDFSETYFLVDIAVAYLYFKIC
jgi:hypothetical protein